jgi:arylsulfatase
VHEGGISTPLVAHWPKGFRPRGVAHAPCHVVDLLPTILEATGAAYLNELGGHEIQPLQGESLLALLKGEDWQREQPIFWEHEGNAAIRLGPFKLVRLHDKPWELYDLEADRTELTNLAGRNLTLERDLIGQYYAWAKNVGVIDWNEALPKLIKAWQMETVDG